MRPSRIALVAVFVGPLILAGSGLLSKAGQVAGPGQVSSNDRGLHGYISFDAEVPPARSEFSAGMGFYSAVWPLIGEPIAGFQIGLPSAWIIARQLGQQGSRRSPLSGPMRGITGPSAGRPIRMCFRPSRADWGTGPGTISGMARRNSA